MVFAYSQFTLAAPTISTLPALPACIWHMACFTLRAGSTAAASRCRADLTLRPLGRRLQDLLQLHGQLAEGRPCRRRHLPARLHQAAPLRLAPRWHLRTPARGSGGGIANSTDILAFSAHSTTAVCRRTTSLHQPCTCRCPYHLACMQSAIHSHPGAPCKIKQQYAIDAPHTGSPTRPGEATRPCPAVHQLQNALNMHSLMYKVMWSAAGGAAPLAPGCQP